ncbi:hypothetical protein Vretifemale_15653, partial [Volvox reticuliferus]
AHDMCDPVARVYKRSNPPYMRTGSSLSARIIIVCLFLVAIVEAQSAPPPASSPSPPPPESATIERAALLELKKAIYNATNLLAVQLLLKTWNETVLPCTAAATCIPWNLSSAVATTSNVA